MTTKPQTRSKRNCIVDIATTEVVSVPPTMRILEGIETMSKNNFRRLPITDPGTKKLLGIVTVTDIIDMMGGGNRYNLVAKKHGGNLLSALNDDIRMIATENVSSLHPSAGIAEAAKLLLESGHGSFPILNADSTLAGIVTEYDIMKVLVTKKSDLLVVDVMTSSPKVITPDVPLSKVTKEMVTHGFRRLPVVKDGLLIGIITATDVMHYIGNGSVFSTMEKGTVDELMDLPTREIMTAADIRTVNADFSVNQVAKAMVKYGIGAFPVMENHKLTGIITEADLVKALAA